MTPEQLIQLMREAGSLENIRSRAEELKKWNPKAYESLCAFYEDCKRWAKGAK